MTVDLEHVQTQLESELHGLGREIEAVKNNHVLPRWGTDMHGFARTLYGYVMTCFAYIDLLSRMWRGRNEQTARMVGFMDTFMETDHRVNIVAVQMWRHGLMHTANPQTIESSKSGDIYRWLLHWGEEHLPPEQNLTFERPGQHEYVLNMTLDSLAAHLKHACWAFFQELRTDDRAAALAVERWLAAQREVVSIDD